MKICLPALAALLALLGCATANPANTPAGGAVGDPAGRGLPGPVTYEVRSWGRLILHWQVNPDGRGEIWRRGQGKEAELRKFRLRIAGSALRTFVANVEDARAATRDKIACKKEIFDLPYGSITWDYPAASQVYAFDAGCRSDEADAVQDILTAATSNVETLAKIDSAPYMVEPLPPR